MCWCPRESIGIVQLPGQGLPESPSLLTYVSPPKRSGRFVYLKRGEPIPDENAFANLENLTGQGFEPVELTVSAEDNLGLKRPLRVVVKVQRHKGSADRTLAERPKPGAKWWLHLSKPDGTAADPPKILLGNTPPALARVLGIRRPTLIYLSRCRFRNRRPLKLRANGG